MLAVNLSQLCWRAYNQRKIYVVVFLGGKEEEKGRRVEIKEPHENKRM